MISALSVILVLAVLIFVHELGHFLIAKIFGVGVLEFAIGFGPRLISPRIGETNYSIRAVPLLGGFVRMVGDDPFIEKNAETKAGGASPIEGEIENLAPNQVAMMKDKSRWFLNQPYYVKVAVVLAGPVFNFLFAWVIAAGVYFAQGLPEPVRLDKPIIGDLAPDMPGQKAGLKKGDTILTIDGDKIEKWEQVVSKVENSEGRELRFEVSRLEEGKTISDIILVTPLKMVTDLDFVVGKGASAQPVFRIGLTPKVDVKYTPATFAESVMYGGLKVVDLAYLNCKVLYGLVIGALSPTRTIGGPIAIITETAKQAEEGFVAILWTMVFLNVTLGIMNLLPIPVLDGGHLTLFTLERLRGRPLSLRFQEIATQIGMLILLMLMVFAVGNDISKLFAKYLS